MNEKSTLKTRWQEYSPMYISQSLLLLLVTLDYTFGQYLNHGLGNYFYILALGTFVLISLPLFKFYINFKQRYLIVIGHFIIAGVFLTYFAPIDSAYYFLFFFYLTVAMYWYGWRGYIGGTIAITAITIYASYLQFPGIGAMEIYHVAGHYAILMVSTLYIALLMLRKPIAADARFLRENATFEHARLVSLINSMADSFIATDEKGIITLYNGATLNLFNTNDALEDKPIDYYLKLLDEDNNPVDLLRLARNEDRMITRKDLHFFSNEKINVYVVANISPIRSAKVTNLEGGFIITLRDISKEKSVEDERKEFISVTSHELRTPIAITEADIATVLRPNYSDKFDPTAKELLEQAHKNIIFLGDLINDLATLDKAEHGDLSIHIGLINPIELIEELTKNYESEAKAAGLEIRMQKSGDVNSLLSSEVYIKEILQNFISNALKYTKQGTVTLSASEGKNGKVIFSVADTGIGIASTDKKNVFNKFYRSESFETRQTRGTGLGLYITDKLAKRIKARIWFESELNHGSTFYLEVPPVGALKQDQQKVAKEEIKEFASSV